MKQVCNVTEALFVKLFNEWSPPTQARDVTLLASSVLASSCKNRGWSCKNRAEAARFLTVQYTARIRAEVAKFGAAAARTQGCSFKIRSCSCKNPGLKLQDSELQLQLLLR